MIYQEQPHYTQKPPEFHTDLGHDIVWDCLGQYSLVVLSRLKDTKDCWGAILEHSETKQSETELWIGISTLL